MGGAIIVCAHVSSCLAGSRGRLECQIEEGRLLVVPSRAADCDRQLEIRGQYNVVYDGGMSSLRSFCFQHSGEEE